MPQRRIKMIVQYDGAPFMGWQRQAGQATVQGTLEDALAELLGREVRVQAAGRTDAGVHAAAMPVHFDVEHSIPAERLPLATAKYLPDSISVLSAEDAAPDFHARLSARLRWYRYQILFSTVRRPLAPRAWRHWRNLDIEAMREGLRLLRGRHDFCGFRSSECQAGRTVLDLQEAELRGGGGLLAFDFKCRSFLHHMVRFMVGTLAAMGQGMLDRERLLRILEHGERPQLILCAPPEGLCLMRVGYSEEECGEILRETPEPPSF